MTIRSEPLAAIGRPARQRPASLAAWLDRESVFSWLMMATPLLFLAALVGYPFCYGILLSLENRPVAQPGTFVGLQNFLRISTTRCSGGSRSTPLSTPALPRC